MQIAVTEARARIAERKEAARARRAEHAKQEAMKRAVEKFVKKWERDYDRKHKRG